MKRNISLLLIAFLFAVAGKSDAMMYWNYGFFLNGSNWISVANSPEIDITGSLTMECWLYPTDTTGSRYVMVKGNPLIPKYGLRISNGYVRSVVAGTTKLVSKTRLTLGEWTHVSATYNDATGLHSIYLNGVLDTSVINAGTPTVSTDSLIIGKNFLTDSYIGYIDEVRLWNRALSSSEVGRNFRTTLAANSGVYSNLSMSLTFQDQFGNSFAFTTNDLSGNFNHGRPRNGTAIYDHRNRPGQYLSHNEALELDGTGDYAAGGDAISLSPTSAITLEAWVYPRNTNGGYIIHKGTADFTTRNYGLKIDNFTGKAVFTISTYNFLSSYVLPVNEWTHLAFTYTPAAGGKIYVNGVFEKHFLNNYGNVPSTTDSLYIGGTNLVNNFNGYIDEVRISSYVKSEKEIADNAFISINAANQNPSFYTVAFNLDGYTTATDYSRMLNLRRDAVFSSPCTVPNQPVSPINRFDGVNFSNGFHLKQKTKNIPATGTSGLMEEDSLEILLDLTMTDVNLFVAVNHELSNDLEITLIAPNGEAVDVCFDIGQLGTNDNIVTIFDDNADSSLVSGKYTSISSRIKPQNNLNSMFSGDNCKGIWRLKINDDNAGNTGKLYAWGVQVNNLTAKPAIVNSNCLIQGFYSPSLNTMIRDTMRIYLRDGNLPGVVVDSAKDYLGNIGAFLGTCTNTGLSGEFYLQLQHRNSIETWSAAKVRFDYFTMQMSYGFRTELANAYGSNMIQVDASPVRYALFSGDVNKDGIVDGSDGILIDNDATAFNSGYLVTDLTGDNFVDGTDALIADNNAANFVEAEIP